MENKNIFLGVLILVMGVLVLGVINVVGVVGQEDPRLSPVDATVNINNALPVIVTVYTVVNEGGTIAPIIPFSGDTNNMIVRFLVEDVNGIGDLPDTGTFTQSISVGDLGTTSNIEVYITNPGVDYTAFDVLADTGSCQRLSTCPDDGGTCAVNQMEFECTVPMEYYYEPSASYILTVGIADLSGGTDSDTASFEYLANADFDIDDGPSWGSISLSGVDQLPSNNPMILTNLGNVDFGSGSIRGADLTPDGGQTGDSIPVTAFGVSVLNGLGGDSMLDECGVLGNPNNGGDGSTSKKITSSVTPINVGGAPNLPYGDEISSGGRTGGAPVSGVDEEGLYFCLWLQLDIQGLTFSENVYSTSSSKCPGGLPANCVPGTNGHPWDLVLL